MIKNLKSNDIISFVLGKCSDYGLNENADLIIVENLNESMFEDMFKSLNSKTHNLLLVSDNGTLLFKGDVSTMYFLQSVYDGYIDDKKWRLVCANVEEVNNSLLNSLFEDNKLNIDKTLIVNCDEFDEDKKKDKKSDFEVIVNPFSYENLYVAQYCEQHDFSVSYVSESSWDEFGNETVSEICNKADRTNVYVVGVKNVPNSFMNLQSLFNKSNKSVLQQLSELAGEALSTTQEFVSANILGGSHGMMLCGQSLGLNSARVNRYIAAISNEINECKEDGFNAFMSNFVQNNNLKINISELDSKYDLDNGF